MRYPKVRVPGPPRKSYRPVVTPLDYMIHRIPTNTKYFAGLASVATAITQLHPNTVVTLGPPVIIGGLWASKRYDQYIRQKEAARIRDADTDIARTKKYDESDIHHVLNGIENRYDHFKSQILEIIEQRIIAYVSQQVVEGNNDLAPLFMEGSQFSVNLVEDPETFVTSTIKVDEVNCEFVKASFAFVSGQGKRSGTVSVYLLEIPRGDEIEDYKILMEISTYRMWSKRVVIERVGGEEVTEANTR